MNTKKPSLSSKLKAGIQYKMLTGKTMTEKRLKQFTQDGITNFRLKLADRLLIDSSKSLAAVVCEEVIRRACPSGYTASNVVFSLTKEIVVTGRSSFSRIVIVSCTITKEPEPEAAAPEAAAPEELPAPPVLAPSSGSMRVLEVRAKAEIHQDVIQNYEFDLAQDFQTAADVHLLQMATDQFKHEQSVDNLLLISTNPQVQEFVAKAKEAQGGKTSFFCEIDLDDATLWIRENRPHLAEKLADIQADYRDVPTENSQPVTPA
jgi:hypothetical protein